MSAVIEKMDTSASIAASASTTSVERRHQNIDHHVAAVAKQVSLLILPIMAAWPMPGSFPGQDQLVEADDLLLHLIDETYEWEQERPKPSACNLMAEVQGWLEKAIEAIDTRDALDGHDARRLLVREALTRATAARHWCYDSHARVEVEAAQGGTRAPEPSPTAEPVNAKDRLLVQHAKVFDGISLQASILLRLVDGVGASADSSAAMEAMDAIRIIVASIGSLADGFNNEDQRGNQYGWHLGENISGGVHG